MEEEYSVSVTQLIQKMNLINHTPEIDTRLHLSTRKIGWL